MESRYAFTVQIVVPLLTFIVGMLFQYWLSNRSISAQELSTAIRVVSSEKQVELKGVRSWAEEVIKRYEINKKEAAQAIPSARDNYIVPAQIQDSVCLFAPEALPRLKSPKTMIMDSPDSELIGMDARVALLKAFADYKLLKINYDYMVNTLHKTCGFLKKTRDFDNLDWLND